MAQTLKRETTMKKIYFVGRYKQSEKAFDIQGIFTTRNRAIAACRTWEYFVIPLPINTAFQHETIVAENTFYPIARNK